MTDSCPDGSQAFCWLDQRTLRLPSFTYKNFLDKLRRCLGSVRLPAELYANHSSTKVVQIIKCTCTVFIDNFRNISTNSSIKVSVCSRSYDGYVKHKRNDQMCDPWDSQGNEKMQFRFPLLFALTF